MRSRCLTPWLISLLAPGFVWAQSGSQTAVTVNTIELPSNEEVFTEDSDDYEELREKKIKTITAVSPPATNDLDFKAPSISFDKEKNQVSGTGGVIISGMGLQSESSEGQLDLNTNQAALSGDVVITGSLGGVTAERANFSFEDETGSFENSRFSLEEDGYQVEAEKAEKLSEIKYSFSNANFSTCHCDDGQQPWWIHADECNITQEGYAHSYDTTVHLFGAPIFYTPYFGFPAKTERASGLLVPSAGYSRRDGIILKVPVFVVLDDSTDATLAPFTETQTRTGMSFDFRKAFSRESKLDSRLLYSNESARGESLRGTVVDGIYDPTIDTNRFGGYYAQQWSTKPESEFKGGFVADLHYVSDDLMARELEDSKIVERQARYTTSTAVARTNLGQLGSAELSSEFNQSFETDDDIVLQRLPEFRLNTLRSFRPFGFNPLGVKLVTDMGTQVTNFVRSDGYDGWRSNIGPSLSVPIRYKGYFNSGVSFGLNQTWYNLDDNLYPGTTSELDSSTERSVAQISYAASTALERVYELQPGNMLTYLTSLGSENQSRRLARVKHVIEPTVSYTYIPDTSQAQNPLFDSFDRIRERSLFTYGVSTTLLGRYVPRKGSGDAISELTPRPQDLPAFSFDQPLADVGSDDPGTGFGGPGIDRGEIRELVSFGIKQSYDYKEASENNDPLLNSFSDIGTSLGLYPTKNFTIIADSNYSRYKGSLSSWSMLMSLKDDRGDAIRSRTTYVRNSLSQVEGNVELVLTERIKAGYYARYDEKESEVIEQMLGVRLLSSCDCWHFDVGFKDTINPDKQTVLLSFTFGGLGDISQDVLLARDDNA